MSLRLDFVTLASQEGANFSDLCRRFGICRRIGYKWLHRFKKEGPEGLKDRSRRPHRSPKRLDATLEQEIVEVRGKHPAWGPRKVRCKLAGETKPAPSTIAQVLKRHDLVDPAQAAAHKPLQRFEREAPNQLWQMDFKGHFALARGGRCHPLTVLDDHSRYLICLQACLEENIKTVQPIIRELFIRYGLPEAILCDNGPPWGCAQGEYTQLGVWLLRLGVRICHGRPRHPQTQGKDERFHRTLQAELLCRSDWLDLDHCHPRFEAYRELYNHQRPHQALDMNVPSSRYKPSPRSFAEPPEQPHYDSDERLITVKSKGEITLNNRFFYVGLAFKGLTLALRPIAPDGTLHLCLGPYPIGLIDLNLPNNLPKGNYHPLQPINRPLSKV